MILKIFISIVLLIIASAAFGQSIKLPHSSNIYPDTFALYWERRIESEKTDNTAKFSFMTSFEDEISVTGPGADSIVIIPFDYNYADYTLYKIYGTFFKNGLEVDNRNTWIPVSLTKIVSDKIEALNSLVQTNGNLENLKLLADAYEEKQCYVNAIYIYYRMMLVNPVSGERYFREFYQRNFKSFNPPKSAIR
jgi:hypothetical protein